MKRNSAKFMALGGVTAALAVVIMSMGTLIPFATYVCPMLCAVLLTTVYRMTDRRVAWAWFGAVALLSMLLAPDKEAAAVLLFLGYYPIVKPWFDKRRLAAVWKFAFFNASIAAVFSLMLFILGFDAVSEDFRETGIVMAVILLVMGNVTLFMLDTLLGRLGKRKRRG